jgi:SAM-dependent methyltransferase
VRASYGLNDGSPMTVETSATEAGLEAMWRHISGNWSELGSTEPHWSVLTDSRFLTGSRPTAEDFEFFFDSGRGGRNHLLAYLNRAGLSPSQFPVVAEYGCGLGRTTRWLAEDFAQVRAIDISAPHLALARSHLDRHRALNVSFIHLEGRDGLSHLAGIDLFFSLIVLQHNPPPVIMDILGHAFAGLNPGGVAFFQVPTYSINYEFAVERYLQKAADIKGMEIHFVPQSQIFGLARQHGLSVLDVRQDGFLGIPETAISNTFLMRKM